MSTSNSVDFTVNRNEIIESALQAIGELAVGQVMQAEHIATGAKWLNLLVKQWQGTSDFAQGMKVWSRKRGYVFLQTDKHEYALGSTGWHATNSYSSTTISTSEALGQTALSVTSTTGMTAADNIGIQLDDGSIQWTTISSTGAGPTVTVGAALTAAAAAGNRVFWYTTKLARPITVLQASLLDVNGDETFLDQQTFGGYESNPSKNEDGTPACYYYEAQLANGVLYTDTNPTDVTDVLRIVYLANIQDFDASADTPDYPQEYNLALVMGLAKYLAPVYGRDFTQNMLLNYTDAVSAARSLYPETCDLYFQSS